jgi:activator of 2-hydroxyglutaryl-CoA dehydratase/predicted nucleotide-binding protein (sugar kinase/HSP70/actin superfamily)
MENSQLAVGLDIGSTTVKVVVLDQNQNILFSSYQRHFTKQAECVLKLLTSLEAKFPELANQSCPIFLTGSGAETIAQKIGGHFIQEVNAVAYAVETLIPDANSVIELGGQDAKIIIFKPSKAGDKKTLSFMNDKCASGTGATIDKCMIKLGIPEEEVSAVSFEPEKLHHVAAKCGVFAETDIVNLVKAGVPSLEILNSLADAIVNQNLSVLTKGYTLKPKVVLLGGPNNYLPFLVESWKFRIRQTWQERGHQDFLAGNIDKQVIVPSNSLYFAALGACYSGLLKPNLFPYQGKTELAHFIEKGRKEILASISVPALHSKEQELDQFINQYQLPTYIPYRPKSQEIISGHLGFDGGSTSSKCVFLNDEGKILFKEYTLSKGNPFEDLKTLLSQLKSKLAPSQARLQVQSFGVTGYAANVFEKIYNADVNVIETIAHMKSSQTYFGDIDVICDIGGQDIKVLFLNHGELSDFKLSNQCSAGNGMILQAMAEQFGHPVQEYAEEAFKAEIAPVFSYGCAVFLDSDRVTFQKQGFSKNEIMAGMAQVLPKNIWQYVVQVPRLEQFGTRYVLQGGTQYNLAALKAQIDYIKQRVQGAEIFLHPHPGEAGAIGAALEAKERVAIRGYSNFIGIEDSLGLFYTTRSDEETRCHFCPNLCSRTFIDAETPNKRKVRYISGFSCEKGTVENKEQLATLMQEKRKKSLLNPNLVRVEARELLKKRTIAPYRSKTQFLSRRSPDLSSIKIAMPRVLNMWVMAPFFNAYFQALGLKAEHIIWSSETNEQMGKNGMKYGAIDPCFPAKVAQAHFHQILFEKSCDYLYFPAITHIPTYLKKIMGATSCPVVQGTPLVMKSSFTAEKDMFAERNIEYINDALDFTDITYLAKQLYETWGKRLQVPKKHHDYALKSGMDALQEIDRIMQDHGRKIIEQIHREQTMAILLLGRPYHLDPGINHQILDEVQSMGFPVLTMRSIPKDPNWLAQFFLQEDAFDINDVWPENFSTNSAQKVWAAKLAARIPRLAVIDISNFKCGHDAPTYGIIESIMRASKSAFLTLHDLDQTSPSESFKIRLKTFSYNLHKRIDRFKSKGAPVCPPVSIGLTPTQEPLAKKKEVESRS